MTVPFSRRRLLGGVLLAGLPAAMLGGCVSVHSSGGKTTISVDVREALSYGASGLAIAQTLLGMAPVQAALTALGLQASASTLLEAAQAAFAAVQSVAVAAGDDFTITVSTAEFQSLVDALGAALRQVLAVVQKALPALKSDVATEAATQVAALRTLLPRLAIAAALEPRADDMPLPSRP